MPHCDLKLYEMVIRANWTLEGLCSIVFLANRFIDYVDKCVCMLGLRWGGGASDLGLQQRGF
ncbi:hypothetical protein J3R83DRAFT_2055 [Lanmaoa asiatica]|nr:hypothetical protein J3R83DRAFT_2055 [Lanmaoa asiatica]